MKTKEPTEEQVDAREKLRELYPPGSTVTTLLRHVSRSGMSRAISVVSDDEEVSWLIVRAFPDAFTFDRNHGGIKRGGCGMDMGFDLAYSLSRRLYPEGFDCTGEDRDRHRYCPSNDHSNGDRSYAPHHHNEGGYALRHRWL